MFGLDLKSLIIGAIIGWFVIPFLMQWGMSLTSGRAK